MSGQIVTEICMAFGRDVEIYVPTALTFVYVLYMGFTLGHKIGYFLDTLN